MSSDLAHEQHIDYGWWKAGFFAGIVVVLAR